LGGGTGARTRSRLLPVSVLGLVAMAASFGGASMASASSAQPPNIIVIQTDDQDNGTVNERVMPNVVHLLSSVGTTFRDYIDSGPLCCPSRAVLLTGQYGHNNGVMWNSPNPYGDLVGKDNTLPVWLQQAGYVTAHVGKYLNYYGKAVPSPNEVAPGWDEWHTALEGAHTIPYYDYRLRENGHAVDYGSAKRDYITRVLNDKAVHLIHEYVPGPKPLFLSLDQVAPHIGPNRDSRCHGAPLPYPTDSHKFEHAPLPESPAFNEADVSDKPRFVREKPRLTPDEIADLQRVNGCRLASLQAVDRGVEHIYDALREEGALKNTAILYTSDNGYLLGQHREVAKVVPYEKSLHVPLVVRVPPRFRPAAAVPQTLSSTVGNVDLAPTILDLAGAQPCPPAGACRVLDGRSLLAAIQSDGEAWPRHRALPLELDGPRARANTPCDYQGLRTGGQVYIEYLGVVPPEPGSGGGPCEPDNEVEHYDLRADPFELDNIFPAPAGTPEALEEEQLAARVARLSDCAGIQGRDPMPASGHYCE
jgi:arylsulfatase A-like enzyme